MEKEWRGREGDGGWSGEGTEEVECGSHGSGGGNDILLNYNLSRWRTTLLPKWCGDTFLHCFDWLAWLDDMMLLSSHLVHLYGCYLIFLYLDMLKV